MIVVGVLAVCVYQFIIACIGSGGEVAPAGKALLVAIAVLARLFALYGAVAYLALVPLPADEDTAVVSV